MNKNKRRFRLYIDESGNSDLGHCDNPNHRFLSLCGVIIELDYVQNILNDDMTKLKTRFFGKPIYKPIVFHRSDMTNQRNQFRILKNNEIRKQFNIDLADKLKNWEFTVLSVLIDKQAFINQYLAWRENPYHYCLMMMLERYCHFLKSHNGVGDVLIESRGKNDDIPLSEHYNHLYKHGTNFMKASFFQEVLTSNEIKIKKKSENIAGLQISDLIAVPIRNRILEKYRSLVFEKETYGKQIFETIKPKIYSEQSRIWGYGLKFIP